MKSVKIVLTPEQQEQVRPLYEALNEMADTGLGFGLTLGQLGGEDIRVSQGFSFAVFAVFDHEGAVRIHEVVNREVTRMRAAEQTETALISESGN